MCEKAMNIKRITAIVPTYQLIDLEKCLRAAGVPGMTIDSVRRFGEHGHGNRASKRAEDQHKDHGTSRRKI
jgi:nitrogen regulatory protein PII